MADQPSTVQRYVPAVNYYGEPRLRRIDDQEEMFGEVEVYLCADVDQCLSVLQAENQQLRDNPRSIMVTQPNGEPFPAPCAIDGCKFDALQAERDTLKAENARLRQEKR